MKIQANTSKLANKVQTNRLLTVKQSKRHTTEAYYVFIDLEKAYDRVPRKEVWNCMRMKGVPEKFIRIVQDMYQRSYTQVRTAMRTTERFEVTVGVQQGSALSSFLFAMVMECLTEDVRSEAPWIMMFADNVVICAERQKEVEERLERWRRALEDREMRISRKKTEYLCVGGRDDDEGELKMQGEVSRVTEFRYLGSTVQADGDSEIQVAKRIAAGWNSWRKVLGVLCDRKAPLNVKGKLHKVVVRLAMLYSTETLAVTQRMEKKLEVAEMRMLRFECGITRLDKVKNEEVRSKLTVGQLGGKDEKRGN